MFHRYAYLWLCDCSDVIVLVCNQTVNKTGVLAEVAAVIADSGSNIEEVSVLNPQPDVSAMNFLLQVKDRTHLARIMRNVRKMQNVNKVSRDGT